MKTVLVTGGSSGIGRATALKFAQSVSNVAFTYKSNKTGADELVKEIEKLGQRALAIQADLINEAEAKNVVDEVVKTFGRIDVLVNNAGRYIDGDEWDGSSDIWLRSLQQNLVSVMNVSKYAIEIFQKQKSGAMVNVASIYSVDGQYEAPAYAASKAGVVNVTQAYAKLLESFGRANAVSPGPVRAGYWLTAPKEEVLAQGTLIEPEEVADKIFFLASDDAKDINGQNILITVTN